MEEVLPLPLSAAEKRAKRFGAFVERVSRRKVLRANNGLCGICGHKLGRKWCIDHIIPLSKGGTHEYANVQPAHHECNRMKADLLPWDHVPIGYSQKGKKLPYRNDHRRRKR